MSSGKGGKGLGKGAATAHLTKKAKKEEEAHKWVMHTNVAFVCCVSEEGMELKPTPVPLKALPMFFQTAIKKQQDAQPKEEDEKVVDFEVNLCDDDSFECITQYVSSKALSEELGINDDDEEEEGEEDEDEEEEAFDDFETLRDHLENWIGLLPLKFAKAPTIPILVKASIVINKLDQ